MSSHPARPAYDVEADWTMLHSCNYRCEYCLWPHPVLARPRTGLPDTAAWVEAFARTGMTWLIHLTGGEPTLHHDFVNLAAQLSERHFLTLNSNLSRPVGEEFARAVDPSRVNLIHAALHPLERVRKQHWPVFQRNIEALRAAGHPLLLSVVATPQVLEVYERFTELCQPLGLRPVPKMLRGVFNARPYPASYTDAESAALVRYGAWASAGYSGFANALKEQPTIWPMDDGDWLTRSRDFTGRMCHAGSRFVAIDPQGDVFRCGSDTRLGNLLAGDFARMAGPAACAAEFCFYFCRKYAEPAPLGQAN